MSEYNQDPQNSSFQSTNLNDFSQPAKPDNYLVISIVATVLGLCSCIGLILGIIAIVFATQVDSKYSMGDYDGAQKASNNAKILAYISLGFAALGIIINVVYMIVVGGTMFSQLGY